MKKTKKRALYIIAALLAALFVLSCLAGFAACGGGSGDDEKKDTPTEQTVTVSSVSISGGKSSMTVGDEATLTASVTMSDNSAYTGSYTWSTSDSTKVSISGTGASVTVKAEAAGSATIKVSVSDDKSTTYAITVSAAPVPTVTGVSLNEKTLAFEYGGSATTSALEATVTMTSGSYSGTYTWSSSNTNVATVLADSTDNSKATVTAVKCGEATITVSVGEDDNVKTAECEVTVSEDHTSAEASRVSAVTTEADLAELVVTPADEQSNVEALAYEATGTVVAYDAAATDDKTYTVSGVGSTFGEDLAKAFWGATNGPTHKDCQYIDFALTVNAGETIKITTYNGGTLEKTRAMYGAGVDGTANQLTDENGNAIQTASSNVWVIDTTDHTEGDWKMELDVTYAGGDKIVYTIVLGDIETGVSSEEELNAAIAEGGEVALTDDMTLSSSLTIGSSGGTGDPIEVTLDLNGCELSYTASNSYEHTIVVNSNATLTVIDSGDGSGVVDVTRVYNAALYNEGTVILEGGTFQRSSEDAMEESKSKLESGYDSYYTVENHGTMTIEDGAVVFNAGDYSTCLKNGGDKTSTSYLTINGGVVYGGKFAVKNDFSGVFTMTGGQIGGLRSETDSLPYRALDNYDEATITGGKLVGGNGGAIDVDPTVDGAVAEGLVIYNNSAVDSNTDTILGLNRGVEVGTLTIGDGNGNGPEIIYEGINPDAEVAEEEPIEETRISYYEADPVTEEETAPAFATGIAIESGKVNVKGGTIECSDTAEDRDYNFMGVYLTNGTLSVSGGKISGDEAIAIDCTADDNAETKLSVTGGELTGNIVVYTTKDGETVASVYTPGEISAAVSVPSGEFTFNNGTFDGTTAEIKETVGSDGTVTVKIDDIVANVMSDEQKAAFDASYASDTTTRYYIAVQIAVQPGETVTVSAGGKTETITNDTNEIVYTTWVIEIGQSHFSGVTAQEGEEYVTIDLSTFSMSVAVTASDNTATSYTIAFGDILVAATDLLVTAAD